MLQTWDLFLFVVPLRKIISGDKVYNLSPVLSKTDRFLTLNRYFLTGSTCTSREVEQKIHSGARPGYLRSEQQTKRNDTNQCEFKANTRYRNLAGKNERGTQIPLFFSFVAQVLKPITERFRITWTPN